MVQNVLEDALAIANKEAAAQLHSMGCESQDFVSTQGLVVPTLAVVQEVCESDHDTNKVGEGDRSAVNSPLPFDGEAGMLNEADSSPSIIAAPSVPDADADLLTAPLSGLPTPEAVNVHGHRTPPAVCG